MCASEVLEDHEMGRVIGNRLAAWPEIKLGILFGSMRRGQEVAASDLDLGVDAGRRLSANEKIALIEDLAELSGRPVDLIDLASAGGVILRQIVTTGKVVHCTDRHLYAELIKKMLFHEADWMPYRSRILAERREAWIGV
jgi:predicted nucleotidyltransferase